MTELRTAPRQEESLARLVTRRFFKHRLAAIALVVLVLMVVLAAAAPLSGYSPTDQNPSNQFQAPNSRHWFGTDELGRDVYSRVIYGSRVSIPIALLLVFFAATIGSIVWAATTALWTSGGPGLPAAILVFTAGNVLAFGLEALVAALQALRLEYYELFSRIFIREGRAFAPWCLTVIDEVEL